MKIINQVHQGEVLSHWVNVEKLKTISNRKDIVDPLLILPDLIWYNAEFQQEDLDQIYNISSDDWKTDGLSIPDFKVVSAANNINPQLGGKHKDILDKEQLLNAKPGMLDTRLFVVATCSHGPFTLIEGNKRAVAMCRLNTLIGAQFYLGTSAAIRNYVWARYSY